MVSERGQLQGRETRENSESADMPNPNDMESPRPQMFDFNGVTMVNAFTDNWENVQNFQARPDDILVATYPKAGTTWVSCILDLLYFGQTAPERQTSIPIYQRVPFLEIAISKPEEGIDFVGVDMVQNLTTTPRLIKTHFPVQFVPKSFWENNCKIVYVARNAKDNMVSYYHFDRMNAVQPAAGEWSDYFQRFLNGKLTFGSWYDHVNNWWQKKKTYSNLHYMFFEDLVENTELEINKLCSFLGLSVSPEIKRHITGQVQFDNMKKNDMANYSTLGKIMDFKTSPFMRKEQDVAFLKITKQTSYCSTDSWLFTMSQLEKPQRPPMIDFHGICLSRYFTDNWHNVQNFEARPDDILIATYPKAGTTWVSFIIDALYFDQTCPERQMTVPLTQRVPFLDIALPSQPSGKDLADKVRTSPRIIKSHLPVQFVPKSFWENNCKIVYVARNAKDSAVSYYHFTRMNYAQPDPGDWGTYLNSFMNGKVVFGSWYDHVNSWWKRKLTYPKIHYMFYEDLIEDSSREILKLCDFLGLSPSTEEIDQIKTAAMFDNMKQNKMIGYSTAKMMDQKVSPFLRKGKVGDWKNHFTVAQNEQFDEDYKQQMKDSPLVFRTEF